MAYYRGDYYLGGRARGDYYRGKGQGDPFWGALGSILGNIGRSIIGLPARTAAAGAATGVAGASAGAVTRAATSAIPAAARASLPAAAIGAGTAIATRVGRVARGPVGQMVAAGTIVEMGGRLFDSATGQEIRRRRRMNPANSKALRRSIRRVVGFARLASRSKRSVAKAATALQCFPRRGRVAARRR